MNDKLFGTKGDAAKILEKASTSIPGQAMNEDNRKRAAESIAAQAALDDVLEAAGFTEEIIAFLNTSWNEREFTPEQRIFSISLATINLRQHFPDTLGGKDTFDRVSKEAWEYFDKNK
jgi:hypothetical protein